MHDRFSPASRRPFPFWVLAGLAGPVWITCVFYFSYLHKGWFFQDDFSLLGHYSTSLHASELTDFSNFGRFISRNVYWNALHSAFGRNAEYYFAFNFGLIVLTSLSLYRLFSRGWGPFAGLIAAAIYFLSPATLDSYVWIANSQHLLGHVCVGVFVSVLCAPPREGLLSRTGPQAIFLLTVFVLGVLSNILVAGVLSILVWRLFIDGQARRIAAHWVVLVTGGAVAAYIVYRLLPSQQGAYSTAWTAETLLTNSGFYFGSQGLALLWLVGVLLGMIQSWRTRDERLGALCLASFAFALPFAALVHQRAGQYAAMCHTFALLALWAALQADRFRGMPALQRGLGVALLMVLHAQSLAEIRYFSATPFGSAQRQIVRQLADFDRQHPDVKRYCFRVTDEPSLPSGAVPGAWWFVGFGVAFRVFVDPDKQYRLETDDLVCDARVVLTRDRIELPTP